MAAYSRQQIQDAAWARFGPRLFYVAGSIEDPKAYKDLRKRLEQIEADLKLPGNRIFYLAIPPSMFDDVIRGLQRVGLAEGGRLVVEKPFGRDLESAIALNEVVHSAFAEEDVFRIDHFLGKEAALNILAFRFANGLFEPIWNRTFIDHVQIDVPETLSVSGRAGFYEGTGAFKDMVVTHLFQILAFMAMEPPTSLDSDSISEEKNKVFRSMLPLRPADVVRGQYQGYRDEPGVRPDSETETFVALRAQIDNWRWAGVPFYVRTGKRLPKRVTEVAMEFRDVPHLPFGSKETRGLGPNALVLRIQPDEGIALRFGAKVPGQAFQVRSVAMDFAYGAAFLEETPDAYERLLLDAMVGDPTLFIRADEVEQAWRIVDPILEVWGDDTTPLARYRAGSWGPREADRLLERDGRRWRSP